MVWQRWWILMKLCRIVVVYAWVSSEMLLWVSEWWFVHRLLLLLINEILHRHILFNVWSSSISNMLNGSSLDVVSYILRIELLIHIISSWKFRIILLMFCPIGNYSSFLWIHIWQRWFSISFLLVEVFNRLDCLKLHCLPSFSRIFWASSYFWRISSERSLMVILSFKCICLIQCLGNSLCEHGLVLLSVKPLFYYLAAVLWWWRGQALLLHTLLAVSRWCLIQAFCLLYRACCLWLTCEIWCHRYIGIIIDSSFIQFVTGIWLFLLLLCVFDLGILLSLCWCLYWLFLTVLDQWTILKRNVVKFGWIHVIGWHDHLCLILEIDRTQAFCHLF